MHYECAAETESELEVGLVSPSRSRGKLTQKPQRPSPRSPIEHHSEAPNTIPSTRDDTPADTFGCEILPPPPFPAPPGAPMLSRCVNVRFLNSPLPPAPSFCADPPPLPPCGFSAFLASMRVFFACRQKVVQKVPMLQGYLVPFYRGTSLIRTPPPYRNTIGP